MKQITSILIIMLLIIPIALPVFAEEDVFSIVRKMDEMSKTTTSIAKMSMLTFPYSEDNSNFRDMKVLAYGQGEDNSYMEFISPKSIKGLRILSIEGDQWVYFPSTGRVRKIASKSKDQSVQGVGGDFSYEDLGGGSMEESYTFKILNSDNTSWTLEGIPIKEASYSKIIITVLKENYQAPKIEFYTEGDGHKKDLVAEEYKTISGRLMPTRMTMMNLIKQSKTVVIIHEAEYDIPIDEKYFNPMRFYK
ncbi:MAG: outer membrane lipoprotein-sorting protein [Candidatus Marinimicrobia bacterium]|nr:outer membrane lipoprotein-sorting protein [Candidatus Neomarinimicrobiota bacterium]